MNVMALLTDAVFMNAGSMRDVPRLGAELADVDGPLVFGAHDEGGLELRVPQRDDGLVGHWILRCDSVRGTISQNGR